jgi:AcrR family transcriptional regulator
VSRRAKKEAVARGEVVERTVMKATIDVLASVGYHGLTYEQVARSAKVARTTVYRRWPDKARLVQAAIESMPGAELAAPANNSLRADLLVMTKRLSRFAETAHGVAIMRLFTESGPPDLVRLLSAVRAVRDKSLYTVLHKARQRGELDAKADLDVLVQLLPSIVLCRVLVYRKPLDEAFLVQVVDLMIRAGAPK